MKNLVSTSAKNNLFILFISLVALVGMSPKWFIGIAVWVHIALLIRYLRNSGWKAFIWAWLGLTAAGWIAQYGVFPMPFSQMAPFMAVASLIGLLPFLVDRYANSAFPSWVGTLVFPVTNTLFCYLMDQGPQGTWSNFAYTQFHFSPLMQLVSVTGIYGIVFLISWFAAVFNYAVERHHKSEPYRGTVVAFATVLMSVIAYGVVRLNATGSKQKEVAVATLSMDNMKVMEQMYEDAFGKKLTIPKEASMSDPILAEIQKGQTAFMSDPENPRFAKSLGAMDEVLDDYLAQSKMAADRGAKIIAWSEAAIVNIKNREAAYFDKAENFARENRVYLFFPTAVFHPEKVGKKDKFIENKVLTFSPDGSLLNTYFKNIPVFGVEPSFAGDGKIPTITSPYGNLSPAICYDLDFPSLIAQASGNGADALVVPTGDWQGIDPYHTYMGATRCIENGVSMIKPVANGLSALIDDKGRIIASHAFFKKSDVHGIEEIFNITSSPTLFAKVAPAFVTGIIALFICGLAYLLLKFALRFLHHPKKDSTLSTPEYAVHE